MPTKMRAAIVTGPRSLRVDEVDRPDPGPGEVRVRLEGCGVCASNLTPWDGADWMEYPTPPGDLGHEGWGVVDAVGPDVADPAPGDRVAALSFRSYAEYDIARADQVVALPPRLSGQPFPGEPLGCAFNIFRRAEIGSDSVVAIIGIGFLGAVLTRLARREGATVIAISRRQSSLDLARHYGADHLIPMDDHQAIIERVKDLTGGRMCDRVIEAVGKQWPLDLAGELIGVGGRLVVAGYHQDGPRQVNMQMWNWKGIDVINAHERNPAVARDGVRRAIEAISSGVLDPAPLYTHEYPLEALNAALDDTRDKPGGFVKALVKM